MNKLQRGYKITAYDGAKAVSILGDEGWTALTGESPREGTADFYASRVPIVYRGMSIRANTVASIPFDMLDEAGNVVDSTDDWQNKCGFLPDPEILFWLLEAAWVICGSSYLYKSANKNGYVKILRPLAPASVKWNDNKNKFTRQNKDYAPAVDSNGVVSRDPETIVYLWTPDPSVEWGEPTKYPALAAMHAMGVLYNMDEAAIAFFRRGMMKVTAFVVPLGTSERDKEEFEDKVRQTTTGIKNFFKTIFLRAGKVETVDLGGGLEGLANVPLTKEKREDVAIALGVPMSKLFTESAAGLGGGGVVQADDKRLILDTCLPDWKAMARILNEQVFGPAGGWHIEERHERMDIFQADESQRAASLGAYVNAFNTNPELAMILAAELGIEFSEDTVKALEAMLEDEPEPEPVTEMVTPATQEPEELEAPEMEDEEAEKYAAELLKFQRKALKRIGEAVKFESDIIPADVLLDIQEELPNCKNADDVRSIISIYGNYEARVGRNKTKNKLEADELAAQMKRALDFLEAHV